MSRRQKLEVQAKMCASCIYRPGSPLDLVRLEEEVADPKARGHFLRPRQCHHSDSAVCRGFWDRHKDDFDAGQLAQRFEAAFGVQIIEFVDHDTLKE